MAGGAPVNGATPPTTTAALVALLALLVATAVAGATPSQQLPGQGQVQSGRQLLAAPPRSPPSQWYGQHLLACLGDAQEQLLEAAQPDWSPKTTARCGGFVSAARGIGSTSKLGSGAVQLQAGSGMLPGDTSRATIFPGVGNALVSISGTSPLMGLCADKTKGARCPDVPANVTLFHLPDPRPFFNTSLAPEAEGALRHPAIVSSLVWLDVDGRKPGGFRQNEDQLPCNPPGSCKATIYVPLTRPLPPGAAYACLRGQHGPPPLDVETVLQMIKSAGPTYPWTHYWSLVSDSMPLWFDDTYGNTRPWVEGGDPPYGVVPCVTSYPGVYVVVAYTSSPLPAERQGVDATRVTEGTRRTYTYTFGADYAAVAANHTHMNYLREFTTMQVANATGLPMHHINVTDISQGSVVVSFDVWVPKAFTSAQAQAVHAAVMDPYVGNILASKLMAIGLPLTSWEVAVKATRGPGGLSMGVIIGIAVGGGVALIVVAALVTIVVMRRRRHAVELQQDTSSPYPTTHPARGARPRAAPALSGGER